MRADPTQGGQGRPRVLILRGIAARATIGARLALFVTDPLDQAGVALKSVRAAPLAVADVLRTNQEIVAAIAVIVAFTEAPLAGVVDRARVVVVAAPALAAAPFARGDSGVTDATGVTRADVVDLEAALLAPARRPFHEESAEALLRGVHAEAVATTCVVGAIEAVVAILKALRPTPAIRATDRIEGTGVVGVASSPGVTAGPELDASLGDRRVANRCVARGAPVVATARRDDDGCEGESKEASP